MRPPLRHAGSERSGQAPKQRTYAGEHTLYMYMPKRSNATWPLPCMSMPARHAADLEADCSAVPASTHQRSTSSTGTASPSTSATSACRRTRNQRHHRPANRNDRERTSSSADDHLRAATTTPMCGGQQEVRCSLRASVGDDSFQSKAAMLTARWTRAFKQ